MVLIQSMLSHFPILKDIPQQLHYGMTPSGLINGSKDFKKLKRNLHLLYEGYIDKKECNCQKCKGYNSLKIYIFNIDLTTDFVCNITHFFSSSLGKIFRGSRISGNSPLSLSTSFAANVVFAFWI